MINPDDRYLAQGKQVYGQQEKGKMEAQQLYRGTLKQAGANFVSKYTD